MVRRVVIFFILILFVGCGVLILPYKKTKFGTARVRNQNKWFLFNRKDFMLDRSVYNKIDTNSIYKLIHGEIKKENEEPKSAMGLFLCDFYKFYSNRKLGRFLCSDFKSSDKVLDSRRGDMGYFIYDGENFITEILGRHWHGIHISRDTMQVRGDTITVVRNFSDGSFEKSVYLKEKIPKQVKILSPDW